MGDYSGLVFYQKARQVAKEIDALVKSFPKTMQAAEGHGRHEGTEYIHYLIIAQGSANETDHWLRTVMDIGLSSKEKIQALVEQNNEVRRMLAASINTLKAKRDEHKTREDASPYNPGIDFSNE